MPDYRKMYLALFNSMTDIVEKIEQVQQECEELYVSAPEPLALADYIKQDIDEQKTPQP